MRQSIAVGKSSTVGNLSVSIMRSWIYVDAAILVAFQAGQADDDSRAVAYDGALFVDDQRTSDVVRHTDGVVREVDTDELLANARQRAPTKAVYGRRR